MQQCKKGTFADTVPKKAAKDTSALENTFMNSFWKPFSNESIWTVNHFAYLIFIRIVSWLLPESSFLQSVETLTRFYIIIYHFTFKTMSFKYNTLLTRVISSWAILNLQQWTTFTMYILGFLPIRLLGSVNRCLFSSVQHVNQRLRALCYTSVISEGF